MRRGCQANSASAAAGPTTNGTESAGDVAAVVNQGENSYEQANRGYEQDQNAVAERCAALRPGRSGALVAHGATLRVNVRDGPRDQSRAATQQQRPTNQIVLLQLILPRHLNLRCKAITVLPAHWCAPRAKAASMRPQFHQANTIRKEHDQHHAYAEHHGGDQQQEQP